MNTCAFLSFAVFFAVFVYSGLGYSSTSICPGNERTGLGCAVESEYGTYYLPSAPKAGEAQSKKATFVDLGGPGLFPGSLARFDPSVLPPALVKDRFIVVLGARWGSKAPTKACSDALQRHVGQVRQPHNSDNELDNSSSLAQIAAKACQLETATNEFNRQSALLVNEILKTWKIDNYEVVGASFAASRWQGMLAELEEVKHPDNILIVSPLPADLNLPDIAHWQASQAAAVWVHACKQYEEKTGITNCLQVIESTAASEHASGLLMLAWSPQASYELVEYINIQKNRLHKFIGKFSDRYFHLNAANYPRNELLEYLVGVCSSVVVDNKPKSIKVSSTIEENLDNSYYQSIKSHIENLIIRQHNICHSLNRGFSHITHKVPTCYIELKGDRVIPPLPSDVKSRAKNIDSTVYLSESHLQHGDFQVLQELDAEEPCDLQRRHSEVRIEELAPGMLEDAASLIGISNMYLPKLSSEFNGEFHLGSITLTTDEKQTEKIESTDVIGYCMAGWLVPYPESGELGHAYIYGIGLQGNPAPICEQQDNLVRYDASRGDMSIRESIYCENNERCLEQLRGNVISLSNGQEDLRLDN